MRGVVASSNVHSYLGWQYRLDQRILEPPIEPGRTSVRPFREWQVYSADLLEAHMGALGMEGRMDEVEAWVTALLSPATAKIEAAIRVVGKPRKLARIGANGKRGAEQDEFRGGVDMGEQDDLLSRRPDPARRTTWLTSCLCAQIPSPTRTASRSSPTAGRSLTSRSRGTTVTTSRRVAGTATSSRARATRSTRSPAAPRARA